ncbi:MAG: hypothetical protein K1Y36_08545 [Blastocatellia bacterium]|nr:hypothetical protein [Blastocatellia bacterium]
MKTCCNAILLVLVSLVSLPVFAERLPIKRYTSGDGLAQDRVKRIVRDQRGFLWFCTAEGLSRFDGYQFTNYFPDYDRAQSFNDLLETREGDYWAATNGGGALRFYGTLSGAVVPPPGRPGYRFHNQDRLFFTAYQQGDGNQSNRVNALFQDSRGTIWSATDDGVFAFNERRGETEFQPVRLPETVSKGRPLKVWAFVETTDGTLWIATSAGLVKRSGETGTLVHVRKPVAGSPQIWAMLLDSAGRIWAGHNQGVFVFDPRQELTPVSPVPADGPTLTLTPLWQLNAASGLPAEQVNALFQSRNGEIWVATVGGVVSWKDGIVRSYTTENGLSENLIRSIGEDQAGNLWLGTQTAGAMKFSGYGLTSFDESDGLGNSVIHSLFEDRQGRLCVVSGYLFLNRFDGRRFQAVQPGRPEQFVTNVVGARSPLIIQDHLGDWWVARRDGLYRFSNLAEVEELAIRPPTKIYGPADHGLSNSALQRLFEDSQGNIWISSADREGLSRWDRATNTFRHFTEKDGLVPFCNPSCFCEDPSGTVWIGSIEGKIFRFRQQRLEEWQNSLPGFKGEILCLHLDRRGWLWAAAAGGGLVFVPNPAVDQPVGQQVVSLQGLNHKIMRCITEDQQGNMYFGTAQGVLRYHPETDRMTHYTTVDGLVSSEIQTAFCDHSNRLWFGTLRGLISLNPHLPATVLPPPVYINQLRVAGIPVPIAELGETEIVLPSWEANQNRMQIDFFGIHFAVGDILQYQYRLVGEDSDWSLPTSQRTVNFANLGPGTYRFEVTAISTNGLQSRQPAVVMFSIRRPLWQRWWFLTLVLGGTFGLAFGFHRYRVAQLLKLERLRLQIAADLHDDIGASLSQVAMLSEIVRRQVTDTDSPVLPSLNRISVISAEAMEGMSDIVWSINPRKDRVKDLVRRMRQQAVEALSARDIAFRFQATETQGEVKLAPNIRRQFFLIFKESLNNLLRHSQCTEAEISLTLEHDWLKLVVKDNGRGFDTSIHREGNGLHNMRNRARGLGGKLEILSQPGSGTTLKLTVPLHQRGK